MNSFTPLIESGLAKAGLVLTGEQIDRLSVYGEFLLSYNEKVNLTAVTDPAEVVEKHFIDSLAGLKLIPEGAACADIGTGAGFPGVPLAICRPDIHVHLIDSLQKRLEFLNELSGMIGLTNVTTVHGRGEDLAHQPRFRERFDVTFSRAVARLNVLAELNVPFLRLGGTMLAWKGPAYEEEQKEAVNALRLLGASLDRVYTAELENHQHFIVAIRKDKPTPGRYPRQAGTPKRKPL